MTSSTFPERISDSLLGGITARQETGNEMKMQTDQSKSLNKKTTALLIINMQNDSLHDEGYLAKLAKISDTKFDLAFRRSAIPGIRKLAHAFREKGIAVVYCQTMVEHDWSDSGMPRGLKRPQDAGLTYFVRGTWGVQILDELAPTEKDYVVIAKCYNKFLYSALELYLRNKAIDTLVFTGVGTNACVQSTLRAAADLGYRTIGATDGTAAKSPEVHEAALREIEVTTLGELLTSEAILNLIE